MNLLTIHWALIGIWAVLCVASAIVFVISKRSTLSRADQRFRKYSLKIIPAFQTAPNKDRS